MPGKFQAAATAVLSAGAAVSSHDGYHQIRIAGSLYRLVYLGLLLRIRLNWNQFRIRPGLVHHLAAFDKAHLCFPLKSLLQTRIDRNIVGMSGAIVQVGIGGIICIGAGHKHTTQRSGIQRQNPVVLEEHKRFQGSPEGNFCIFRARHNGIGGFIIFLIRMVEEADGKLHAKDIPHALIYGGHRKGALLHQLAKRQHIAVRTAESAAHIQPGLHALAHSLLHIGCRAMFHVEVLHRIAVGNDISTEAEIPAQAVVEPVPAALHGYAVIVVVTAHRTHQPDPPYHFAPWIDMHILHLVGGHLRIYPRHSLASAFVVGITKIMLGSSGHAAIFLKALHHLDSKFGDQIRILSVNLFIAAPALVAAYIENRSVDIGIAEKPRLLPCDTAYLAY